MDKQENRTDLTTEQKILEAAERLFLEKGFALVSTVEIAREAGCNQALVHYYYRSKELLFQRIFTEKVKVFAASFFDIDKEEGTFEEKLARKVGAHFDMLTRNPRMPFLIMNEITTNPQRIASIKESIGSLPYAIFDNVRAILDEEIKKGNIREISIVDFMFTVLSLNIAPFLLFPIIKNVQGFSDEEAMKFIQGRKQKNITTIINSLQK